MESLNFDKMTDYYDESRSINKKIFLKVIKYISANFPPEKYKRLFEPGIGNGRIAIPLSKKGYSITGIDISEEMLNSLDKKIKLNHISNIKFQKSDVTYIPFDDKSFDISVIVHLFYFIKDWKKAINEIIRVVDGPILFLNTGMGKEIPFLNDKYKEICLKLNEPIKNIGVETSSEVFDYMKRNNYNVEKVETNWKWKDRIKLEEAFNYILNKAYSFTHLVSNNIHSRACEILKKHLIDCYQNLNQIVTVENKINLNITYSL